MAHEQEPETAVEARMKANFATFGDEVPWNKVPELVRAGREVWSFGYGRMQVDMDEDFTTISEDDLEWFGLGEIYVSEWAPFRVAPLGQEHAMSNFNEDGSWKTPVGVEENTMTAKEAVGVISSFLDTESNRRPEPREWQAFEVLNDLVYSLLDAKPAEVAKAVIEADVAAPHIKALEALGYIIVAIAPDEVYCTALECEHWQSGSPTQPECGFCGGEMAINDSLEGRGESHIGS